MIEKRDNLLGAWAIHCDTPDCHIEALSIGEAEVISIAKATGWGIDGTTHNCPDCVAGNSPADVINESLPEPAAPPAAMPPEPMIPSTPDHVTDMDEDDDDADAIAQVITAPVVGHEIDCDMDEDCACGANNMEAEVKPRAKRGPKSKPYNFADAGATIPDVMAKAEDMETPAAEEKRLAREARQRKRIEESKKQSKEKTLAAMGGVSAMLDDFDNEFGSGNTWDD